MSDTGHERRHNELLNGVAEAGANIFRGLDLVSKSINALASAIEAKDFECDLIGDAIRDRETPDLRLLADAIKDIADAIHTHD